MVRRLMAHYRSADGARSDRHHVRDVVPVVDSAALVHDSSSLAGANPVDAPRQATIVRWTTSAPEMGHLSQTLGRTLPRRVGVTLGPRPTVGHPLTRSRIDPARH